MKKKPLIAGISLLAGLLALGGGVAFVKYRSMRAAANQPAFQPPDFVDVVEATPVSWQPTARLVGTVIAKRSVTLANEIAGTVTEVGFDSGEQTTAGQVLVQMDVSTETADMHTAEAAARVARAAVEVAQANIQSSQASVQLAESNQRRFRDAGKSVSASDLDRMNTELDKARADLQRQQSDLVKARAEVEQAEARVRQIQTLIAKKTLRAPFLARASMRTVDPGQYLKEGTSIVSLTEVTDDIYLDFAVPQDYAARVAPGAVVVAKSQMLGSESVRITVVSIDSTVNPTTRNVRVRSSVPNPDQRLKPGMFIDIEVPVEAARQFVAVPTTAVRRAAFGDHVFVLEPGDPAGDPPGSFRARQRMVKLGPDIAGKVIISEGLKMGEQLATSGSFKLHEGSLVMKAPPVAEKSGAAPAAPGVAAAGQ